MVVKPAQEAGTRVEYMASVREVVGRYGLSMDTWRIFHVGRRLWRILRKPEVAGGIAVVHVLEDSRGTLEDSATAGARGKGHGNRGTQVGFFRQLPTSTYLSTMMSPTTEMEPLARYTDLMNVLLPVMSQKKKHYSNLDTILTRFSNRFMTLRETNNPPLKLVRVCCVTYAQFAMGIRGTV